MKAYYLLNVFAFLLFGCAQLNDEGLSDIKRVKVKSILWTKMKGEGRWYCPDNEFNTIESCYYKINDIYYVKKHSYLFSNDGSLREFYRYLPEGALSYTLQDLQDDKLFAQSYDCFIQNIQIYPNFIIDNKDTITVFKIFKNPKVILADKSNFKQDTLSRNTMVIYEY
ncbi:MAG: hypothetical protein ACK4TA_21830 [Saprospiraceae bacterium]